MDAYQAIQEKLASHPAGAPPRPELAAILRLLFTPEEASLAAHLTFLAQPVDAIARLSGLSANEVATLCEAMAAKGLAFSILRKGVRCYGLLPVLPGLFEYPLMMPPRRDLDYDRLGQLWLQYYENGWAQEVVSSPTPLMRVLPVEKAIDVQTVVLPFDQASTYVEKAEAIAVGQCACRKVAHKCAAPGEVCLAFDTAARLLAEHGAARYITKAEAMDVLRRSEEAGLVHCTSNTGERVEFLCNCCPCCCVSLRAVVELKLATSRPISSFASQVVADDCTACLACVDRCPVDAIAVVDLAAVDEASCIGCGLCASACPTEAIHLVRRPAAPEPPRTARDWAFQVAAEKGRLDDFLRQLQP